MSGYTPPHIARFRDLLGLRGSDMGRLADDVGVCRRHLSEIVWGHFKGGNYWARIRACVTAAEWAELLHVENCATWNRAQRAQKSGARVWLMRRQCATCKKWEGFTPCVESMTEAISHGVCPDCYPKLIAEIAALPLDEVAAPQRAYLVRTEAGLAVHQGNSRPALADDRELSRAFAEGDAHAAPITCALGDHPFLSRFNDEPANPPPPRGAG